MELTLKRMLEDAEFKKYRGKGYDPTEVDDFLDRAAAMAGKVEVQLTQALEQARSAGGSASPADVDAEVERRVAARIAELPPPAPAGPNEDEIAEEARRTLALAQRTADAAVREAREDAEKILAAAHEQAQTTVADADARASELRAEADAYAAATRSEVDAEAARERREARQRLAGEIGELEGLRETLRSDVGILERHVEDQRSQLGSTLAELQQILDDPSGFRMAPVPALADPELPDFSDLAEPEAAPVPEATTAEPAPVDEGPTGPAEVPVAAEPADAPPVAEPVEHAAEAEAEASEPAAAAEPAPIATPPALTFEEVDHAAPGIDDGLDAGPPTAPVSSVELGVAESDEDDAFLAELRKAMADDEPLGPRDDVEPPASETLFEEDDRRGWRFGRRR